MRRAIITAALALACLLCDAGPIVGGTRYLDIPGPAGALSVALQWDAPPYLADNSGVATPVLYRIDYGTTNGSAYVYRKWVLTATTTATISSLASGTYYVVVYAIDAGGNVSYASTQLVKAAS